MTPTKTRLDRIAELLLAALNDEQESDGERKRDLRPAKVATAARPRKKSAARRAASAHEAAPPAQPGEVTVPGKAPCDYEARPWLEPTTPRDLVLSASEMQWMDELPMDLRGPLREGVQSGRVGADRLGWIALRKFVLERDRGRCFVCRLPIPDGEYECGHIIDRMVGGPDRASNLVAMHVTCNRLKGVHESRQEFVVWMTEFRELVARMVRPRTAVEAGT